MSVFVIKQRLAQLGLERRELIYRCEFWNSLVTKRNKGVVVGAGNLLESIRRP